MIVLLTIIAFLGALVLGFLGGRDSMLSDLKRKEDELYDANALIEKMEEERRDYILAAESERNKLQSEIVRLRERLLVEINAEIFDEEECANEDVGSQN